MPQEDLISAASRRVINARERQYRAPVWDKVECEASANALREAEANFKLAVEGKY